MVASCYYFFTFRIINTFKLIMLFKRATRRLLELSKPNMRHLTESLVPALMIFNKRSNKLRQRPPLFSIHMIALITVRGLSDGRPTFTQLLNKNFILLHCLSFTSFKLILSLLMFFIYLGLQTAPSNPRSTLWEIYNSTTW